MILLDTNILVSILRQKPQGKEWIEFLKNKSVCISSITAFELFLGANLSLKRKKNTAAVKKLIQEYPVFGFDIESSFIASKISFDLQKKGEIIELNDIYIASIALKNNLSLATENIKHFERIKDLEVIKKKN